MSKQLLMGWVLASLCAGNACASGPAHAPQVSNAAGTRMTVTLHNIKNDARTIDFDIVMETHTRDLGENLTGASVLIADGKQYQPLGWEGAAPGGHHRKGILRFRAITPHPSMVELQIRLTSEPSPRIFKWRLK